MTTAQEILTLIEDCAGPNMMAGEVVRRLDEIDARVYFYRADNPKSEFQFVEGDVVRFKVNGLEYSPKNGRRYGFKLSNKYTRSRDALKGIRPGAFGIPQIYVSCRGDSEEPVVCCSISQLTFDDDFKTIFGWGETEELAELHAILQAIEYERQQIVKVLNDQQKVLEKQEWKI